MKHRSCAAVIAAALISVSSSSCTRMLPPPPTPARTVPVLDLAPPPRQPGLGRLTIDVTNGKAEIERILYEEAGEAHSRYASASYRGEGTEPICVAPCTVNLPYGTYKMRAIGGSGLGFHEFRVTVSDVPSVARLTLGKYEPRNSGASAMGAILLYVGIPIAAIGGIRMMMEDESESLFWGGAAASGAGALIFATNPTIEQESSFIQFHPSDGGGRRTGAGSPSVPTLHQREMSPRVESGPSGTPTVPLPETAPRGCNVDSDCKGKRICVQGACVDPRTLK